MQNLRATINTNSPSHILSDASLGLTGVNLHHPVFKELGNLVGRVGLEPTDPEGTGFTDQHATNYVLPTIARYLG